MANKLRIHSLVATTEAGSGHPSSCLSSAEIMSCLFFAVLDKDDEFILSKGHAAPILWAAFAEAGLLPRAELKNLRKIDSILEGHPSSRMPLIKVATGSLGQGLSAGVGMALAKKLKLAENSVLISPRASLPRRSVKEEGKIFVLLGDGECSEGAVWEAAAVADFYNLDNLVAIIDVNRLGQSGQTMHGHNLKSYQKKFEAFGWQSAIIDGHNVREILSILKKGRKAMRPFAVIAKTVKGKGVSLLENKEGWHGKALKKEELAVALKEIGEINIELSSRFKSVQRKRPEFHNFTFNNYQLDDLISTREAYGRALINLGKTNPDVVVLDSDVKNSTMSEYFFEEFPKRSFQCFIAEQNMVGMAVGFSAMGLLPFVATFSCFLTRAHDFIRMAQYSFANIKFAGSHSGVSIGQDGPSQMGLEDIPMFLNIPGALVLYPSDAVSAEYLLFESARFQGISYLRTTREKTKVLYKNREKFPLGKFKVWGKSKNDKALIVAAGITLHEALKAQEILKKKKIPARVIDLYCLQPIDKNALIKEVKECQNKVIIVEDHYCSAIGSLVASIIASRSSEARGEMRTSFSASVGKVKTLCVKETPRSGKPEELLKKYGIDAESIVKAVINN